MDLAERYVEDLEIPAPGVTCTQPSPFAASARAASSGSLRRLIRRERRAGVLAMPIPALVG